MKIFLTGGTGMIGRALIDTFVKRMDKVVCVSRKETRARSLLPAGVEIIEADPSRGGPWQQEAAKCDVLINLAGESLAKGRWTAKRKKQFRRSRLSVTHNLVDVVNSTEKPQILLSASAIGYYGDGDRQPLYEERDSGSDFLSQLAHEWEGCTLAVDNDTTRLVLLRIGLVFSADGGALPRMVLPYRFFMGGPLGNGRMYLPWIHILDFVNAVLFLIENDQISGPVNVVAPDPPTQNEFASILGEVLERPYRVRVPASLLRLVLGEKADMLLTSYRAVPKVLRAHGFNYEYRDLEAGLRDLLK